MTSNFLSKTGSFLKRQMRALRMARKGNVALIFALSVVPLLVAGGSGIDLARALAVRGKLYAAVDAAALAVASKTGITQAQAQILAQQYFDANYNLDSSFGAPEAVDVTISGQRVTVTSDIAMPTTLMNVAGIHNVNLTASSDVVWGQTKIWVGLALDTTGSMAQGDGSGTKISALKTAVAGTNGLLDKLSTTAATAGDVQLSLIPFARFVNVNDISGSGGATWLDWTVWDETHGSCTINGTSYTGSAYDTKTECEAASIGSCSNAAFNGSQNECQNAGTCSISGNTTQSSCQSAGACSISGYSTQSACQNAGTCTISGNTSENACESAYTGVCSLSGYNTQNACQNAGTCSVAGYTTKSTCQNAYNGYVCKINGVSYPNAPRNTQSGCTASVNGVCSKPQFTTKSTCEASKNPKGVWHTGTWTGVGGAGVWTPGVWSNQYGVWTPTPGTWTTGVWTSTPATWTSHSGVWTANHSGWNGCVTDRGLGNASSGGPANGLGQVSSTGAGYDTNVDPPSNLLQSKFRIDASSSCPAPIKALGYDWADLKTRVNNLTTNGATNQPIGLVWAWHSLTNSAPMNSGALPTNTARFIIIVSDGENTQNRWYGNGSSHSSSVDNRMTAVCDAAKADDVIIYTLFINIAGTAGNASSMKQCATGGEFGGRYHAVSSTGAIGNALDAITQQITNLRVSH